MACVACEPCCAISRPKVAHDDGEARHGDPMRQLREIRRAGSEPPSDLWPRFRERLAAGDRVELRMPAFTWGVAVAAAVAAGVLVLVPEPVRLLAAAGLL
jgi:hypothetical protein